MCAITTWISCHPERGVLLGSEIDKTRFHRTSQSANLLWIVASLKTVVLVSKASRACCFNIGGHGYSLLKHIQACRWLFINYRWMGGGSNRERETEREREREKRERGQLMEPVFSPSPWTITSVGPGLILMLLIKVQVHGFLCVSVVFVCARRRRGVPAIVSTLWKRSD